MVFVVVVGVCLVIGGLLVHNSPLIVLVSVSNLKSYIKHTSQCQMNLWVGVADPPPPSGPVMLFEPNETQMHECVWEPEAWSCRRTVWELRTRPVLHQRGGSEVTPPRFRSSPRLITQTHAGLRWPVQVTPQEFESTCRLQFFSHSRNWWPWERTLPKTSNWSVLQRWNLEPSKLNQMKDQILTLADSVKQGKNAAGLGISVLLSKVQIFL